MAYELKFKEEFNQELKDTLEYYLGVSFKTSFSFSFYEKLEICFEVLIRNPYFENRYKEYRCLPIDNFPFILIFKSMKKIKQ